MRLLLTSYESPSVEDHLGSVPIRRSHGLLLISAGIVIKVSFTAWPSCGQTDLRDTLLIFRKSDKTFCHLSEASSESSLSPRRPCRNALVALGPTQISPGPSFSKRGRAMGREELRTGVRNSPFFFKGDQGGFCSCWLAWMMNGRDRRFLAALELTREQQIPYLRQCGIVFQGRGG